MPCLVDFYVSRASSGIGKVMSEKVAHLSVMGRFVEEQKVEGKIFELYRLVFV